ncbi:CPBP family intramembrane glutamic endopeptidase [uncultured Paraglaciecola sp.]|uniref:CPBP family intramembrane glutamic endopeptidase n=1 Tax=uncultured Paraglaciecola sp. TaxID=1765024 RepID=UPI002633DD5C|nr:CPBP family intramembrane glutamic endopeptidase [uncultured Paraglaciecola sp.]
MFKQPQPTTILFSLGLLGVISMLPVIPKLMALQPEPPPFPIEILQLISVLQSSLFLLLMIVLGKVFSEKVGLKSPVILAMTNSTAMFKELRPQIVPALLGGVLGGALLLIISFASYSYLPAEFIVAGEKLALPWYTKILYGGITEELLIRWGLMSTLVWIIYRVTQTQGEVIKAHNYILAIALSALLFGAGHLPIAFALSPQISLLLICYIVLANAIFGFIAGYLYWKRGLECAIAAHIVAHLTMMFGIAIS